MRKSITALLLLIFVGTIMSKAANRRFFISTSANNKEASAYLAFFETTVYNALKKDFPCVEINSQSTVVALLDLERQKQLLGTGNDDVLTNIGEAMGSDYLICLKVQVIGGTAVIDAFCADSRKAKVISRAAASVPHGSAGISAVEEVSEQLIDGLKNIEICPFKGLVTLTIKSETDTTITEDYGVYCNGMDQRFHKVTEINNLMESNWQLERKGIPWTEGTMTFTSNERTSIEEQNGCHACKSGREGGRTYKLNKSFRIQGNGISHESYRDGKPQEDTRVQLTFLESGKYIINIKGTSLPASGEEKVTESAEGTCDNMTPQNMRVLREVSIPVNVFFGPYTGKATDKTLSQKDSKTVRNPVSKEKETITIDFNLQQ